MGLCRAGDRVGQEELMEQHWAALRLRGWAQEGYWQGERLGNWNQDAPGESAEAEVKPGGGQGPGKDPCDSKNREQENARNAMLWQRVGGVMVGPDFGGDSP